MPQTLDYSVADSTRTATRFARVVPLAFITYSLAFLDRNNFGFAAKGMKADLHLTSDQLAKVPAFFFIGYLFFQIPAANYASRRSCRWLVFWSLILWGLLSSAAGVITSLKWLLLDRIALGAVEGIVLPAMLVFLTRWFIRRERSRANSLLMLANPLTMAYASAASGYIIDYFNVHHFMNFHGWQMMFIVEGLPSLLWAAVWIVLAKDRPGDVDWLAPAEAQATQEKLDAEQSEITGVKDYWTAFSDRRVIFAGADVHFLQHGRLCVYVLDAAHRRGRQRPVQRRHRGLLLAVPYMIASFSIVIVSWISDKTLKRKCFVWGSHFVGALAYLLAAAAGQHHFGLAFCALCIVGSTTYTPTSPQWAWMAEMFPRNVVGESMALVNAAGGDWRIYRRIHRRSTQRILPQPQPDVCVLRRMSAGGKRAGDQRQANRRTPASYLVI